MNILLEETSLTCNWKVNLKSNALTYACLPLWTYYHKKKGNCTEYFNKTFIKESAQIWNLISFDSLIDSRSQISICKLNKIYQERIFYRLKQGQGKFKEIIFKFV